MKKKRESSFQLHNHCEGPPPQQKNQKGTVYTGTEWLMVRVVQKILDLTRNLLHSAKPEKVSIIKGCAIFGDAKLCR